MMLSILVMMCAMTPGSEASFWCSTAANACRLKIAGDVLVGLALIAGTVLSPATGVPAVVEDTIESLETPRNCTVALPGEFSVWQNTTNV
jgi:hypothetical protein